MTLNMTIRTRRWCMLAYRSCRCLIFYNFFIFQLNADFLEPVKLLFAQYTVAGLISFFCYFITCHV
ncbi:hypothetical protein B0O99DRAFT_611488, partial [Bisporella sp. PMI_857]